MKRGFFVFALTAAAAGMASALAFAPVPPIAAPASQASASRTVAAQTAQIARRMPAAPAPAVPASAKPTIEARQAPVPLLMKARPPAELPFVDVDPAGKLADEAGNGLDEGAAKAAIEADGYKGVKVLRKDANGMWHAKGLRGTTEVLLTVDAQGSVATD